MHNCNAKMYYIYIHKINIFTTLKRMIFTFFLEFLLMPDFVPWTVSEASATNIRYVSNYVPY